MTIQRIVSGAHYGMRDWLAQRLTGVIMALYVIFLLCSICTLPSSTTTTGRSSFRGSS